MIGFINIIAELANSILSSMAIIGAAGLAICSAAAGGCYWGWRRWRGRR